MSAENPADAVIEQVAKELVDHRLQYDCTGGHRGILGGWNRNCICGWHGVDHEPSDRAFEHHVAEQITGLLADPADRDEEGLQTRLDISVIAAKTFRARAERAEAEVAELRATIDRVRALADEWQPSGIQSPHWAAVRLRALLRGDRTKP